MRIVPRKSRKKEMWRKNSHLTYLVHPVVPQQEANQRGLSWQGKETGQQKLQLPSEV